MSKKSYPLFAVVLLGSLLVGCTDVLDRDFYDDGYTPSVVLEAKQFIESGKVRVSLLDMGRAYMSVTEKNTKANAKADFSIDWGNYRVRTEGSEDVVYVPIKVNRKKQQAFSLLSEDGRMIGNNHQIYYALMLFPGRNGQGFDAVMATYLYGRGMAEDDVKRMGRDFESADYTGYYITSCLDGTMLAGRYVEDGETKFGFRQNPVSPKDRKVKTASSEQDSIRKHTHSHHLFLNINPLKHIKQTKSGNNDMEWLMTHCSFCGKLWDECDCLTIYPKCEYCNTDVISNRCRNACDRCDVCLVGSPEHNHNTYNPPVNPPGGGGGTGDGDGTGGSGGTGGGNGSGNDGGNSPSFNDLTLAERITKLSASANIAVQAVLAFDNEYGNPNKNKPYEERSMMCNYSAGKYYEAVFGEIVPDYLLGAVYNSTRHDYVYANDWYEQLPLHPADWGEIEALRDNNGNVQNLEQWMQNIQAKADDGYFVVCVAHGINSGRGHIVVVIPSGTGTLVPGNWSVPTPHTIDCGKGRRSNDTDLSAGFYDENVWVNRIRSYYHK